MKYRLTGARANVDNRSVSLLDAALASDFGRGEMAASDEFGVGGCGFFQSGKVFLGNDQHVCRRFRVDVFKSVDVLVFMNFLGWQFSAKDAAENASGIGHNEFHLAETISLRVLGVSRLEAAGLGD